MTDIKETIERAEARPCSTGTQAMTQPSPQYETDFRIGDRVHFVTLDMMGNVRSLHDAEITRVDAEWSGDTGHRVYDVRLADGRRRWGWANQIRKPVEQIEGDGS